MNWFKQMMVEPADGTWSIKRYMAMIGFKFVLIYISYTTITGAERSDTLVIELLTFVTFVLAGVAYTSVKRDKDVQIQRDKHGETPDVRPGHTDGPIEGHPV